MTSTFTLYWISEDGQNFFDMGSFATEQEAEDAIESAQADLISQCGEEHQKLEINQGRFSVDEKSL